MLGFDHMMGLGFALSIFINILFWMLIIYGIVHLIKCSTKCPSGDSRKQETPMDILKRRYAAGEINAEEFAQMKKDLES